MEKIIKEKFQLSIDPKVKEQAKIISAKTKMTVSEIFEYLIQGLTEKDILKLSEKK